jgi:hypothetical protein
VEIDSIEHYSCASFCRVAMTFETTASAIGPAGDILFLPMRITGGMVSDPERAIVFGTNFVSVRADERLMHNGNLVVSDPAGDLLLWFDGTSQGQEGAYDDALDGTLPGPLATHFSVRAISANPLWKALNNAPLFGVGSFDGANRTLTFALVSVSAAV